MGAKYTKEELKYLMKFYEIEEMPIYYNGQFVGRVSQSMKYSHNNALRYMTRDEYAIDLASEQIDDFVKFKQEVNKPFKAEVEDYSDYKPTGKKFIYEGTMDEVFERFYKANRTLRYCNGMYYKFTDMNVEHQYDLWNKSMSHSRSFELYYGNGIVD
jgi:hypothetical protein